MARPAVPEPPAEPPAAAPPTGAVAAGEGGLLVRLRALLPALAPAEQRVASAVLADPPGAAAQTITALARAVETSETTVLRFCRGVGFRGYREFRLALAAEVGRGEGRAAGGARVIGGDIGEHDPLEVVVEKIAFNDARAVEDTAAQLDVGALGRVVDALVAARRIDIYGIEASGFVAADLQHKLRRIGRTAYACTEAHAALTSAALLGEPDVAIGISHTGATADTLTALREARRRGALTVAVTNFPRSPLARAASELLTTATRETTFRSSATSSRIAQLTVIDCIFVGVAQRDYAGTLEALQRTYEAVGTLARRDDGRRR